MSDETESSTEHHRKVISIATRAPVAVDAAPPDPDAPFVPDESMVRCMTELAEMVGSGEIRTLVAIGWDPISKCFTPIIAIPPDCMTFETPFMLLGGLKMLTDFVADAAYGDVSGFEASPEDFEGDE